MTSGRVYELDLHGQSLANIEGLQKYKDLRILDISCNRLHRIEGLSSNFNLQELKLYGNEIEEIEGLERLTGLCRLHLQHNRIQALGSGLVGLRQLKVLRLDHNLLQCVTPPELVSFSKLTHLDLSHNLLTCVDGLGCVHCLEDLNLSSNHLTSLADVAGCSKLQVLNVSYNPICLSSLIPLSAIKLKELWIEGVDMAELKALPLLRHLEELHAAHNKLTSLKGVHTIFPVLELLDICSNLLDTTDDLTPLSHLPSLTDLLVKGNPLCSLRSYQSVVRSILPTVEVIDAVAVSGRPGTGCGLTLQRMEQQLTETEMDLESYQNKITSRLENLQVEISVCCKHSASADCSVPTSSVQASSPHCGLPECRPTSRSGSRARLQHALTFAKEHFHSTTK